MLRRHLIALILRSRGQDNRILLARIEGQNPETKEPLMSDQEVEAWYRLLQNVAEDASRDGERAGARQPWRHGYP